jgi:DAK2 domain fusion protein YloV
VTDPLRPALQRWCDLAFESLAQAREEIDALNVYPVPDGDTGTNLYLTFEAARDAMMEADAHSLGTSLAVFTRGALLGARGNSGVILSQLLRAGAEQLLRGDPADPGRLLAESLTAAADAAYDAVGQPVEGTILTVARAAATAATEALDTAPRDPAARMGAVIRAAAGAARTALERTPEQLDVLARAGVVDAGGRGLCVILDAAEQALTGRRPTGGVPARHGHIPVLAASAGDLSADGPAYEVMFLLDADDASIPRMRERLGPLGDSLVVVGGDGLWNVHVHVDNVGAAIEAGIEAGHPHRIQVTHFAQQQARQADRRGGGRVGTRGLVAVAAGLGLSSLFQEAGAVVVPGRPGRRCSTGEILTAIRATHAEEVVVFPNDSDTVGVAEVAARAARDEGIRTAVVPTKAQVQGLAGIAVHEPGRTFDEDVVHMTAAAGHARHGAVTVAARDAMTMAGPCSVGDSLGVLDGDFAVVGGTLGEVAVQVVDRLLSGGGEMITLVRGVDGGDDLVDGVVTHVSRSRPDVEVVVYEGGQDRYPLLIGVE